MKQFFFATALLISQLLNGAPPNTKDTLEERFKTMFPEAEQVIWHITDNGYEVAFRSNHVDCRMWFREDGHIDRTIRYYLVDHLPPFILAKITEKYPAKKVFGIIEVTSEEGLTYTIILEDEKQWWHVRSDAIGNTSVIHKYKKLKQKRTVIL